MPEFKFFCPYCGQHIQAETADIGKPAMCPACNKTLVIQPDTVGFFSRKTESFSLDREQNTAKNGLENRSPVNDNASNADHKDHFFWYAGCISVLALLLLGIDAIICADCFISEKKNNPPAKDPPNIQLQQTEVNEQEIQPDAEENRTPEKKAPQPENITSMPSVKTETTAEPQQISSAPEPAREVTPQPPAPTPPVPTPPEPELADLPMPMPEKKAPKESQLKLPKYVKKPKPVKLPEPDRTLKNTKKVGQRTGSQTNQDIPIGKKDTAQQYGEKFSNTPNGGPRSDRHDALLGTFLKIRWSAFIPARAQLGDAKQEVTVFLSISGNGRLLEARIERPSGNAAMDSAVRRLLESLKTQQLPRPPDGRPWSNKVIFDIEE